GLGLRPCGRGRAHDERGQQQGGPEGGAGRAHGLAHVPSFESPASALSAASPGTGASRVTWVSSRTDGRSFMSVVMSPRSKATMRAVVALPGSMSTVKLFWTLKR